METYPAYKDSGYDWIGKIPDHWETIQLKFVSPRITDKADNSQKYSLQVALENIESNTGKLLGNGSFEGVGNIFQKGDVLLNKLRPYLNKSILAPSSGVAVGELLVLRPQPHIYSSYLHYCVLENAFISVVDGSTYGAKMPRANWDFIGNLKTTVPPLPEQQAIADFLDRKTEQIDTLIEKKQRQIELLQEQRTALINQAVTKGKKPDNVFEDNGPAPWLFHLPNGWIRQKLKFNSYMKGRIGYQNLRSDEYTDEGPYLVSSAHFIDGNIDWDICNHVTQDRFETAPEIILQKHDVLFMKDGANMGKLAYVAELPGDACLNSHLLLMRPLNKAYLPRFLYFVLGSEFFIAYTVQTRKGTTFFGFSQESMGNFPISLPPVDEQIEIVGYIESESGKINQAINKLLEEIDLLQEYRTALISTAVTGKIDVRNQT